MASMANTSGTVDLLERILIAFAPSTLKQPPPRSNASGLRTGEACPQMNGSSDAAD
jgi:hypothetical protein